MTELVGVFGASGSAREVMPLVRAQLSPDQVAVFVDREDAADLNGHEVWAERRFLSETSARHFVVEIADAALRKRLFEIGRAAGLDVMDVRAPTCLFQDDVQIGPGAVLCDHTMINSNTVIGEGLHLNYYSHISHDCIIGNFVTFSPKVACNGNVVVEDGVFLGAGAILRDGRPGDPLVIGAGAIVGMGAVVTKSVPAGAMVVGNPARIIERN